MRYLRPAGFEVLNRNEFGILLDLTDEVARRRFRDILRVADGVIVAIRPTSRAKLGLDYDSVIRLNPSIVYCAVTGYGETGPTRNGMATTSTSSVSLRVLTQPLVVAMRLARFAFQLPM
jgi:crotonobetainyl-CoA:carnitine CoA-transferase CaiB-like acyl-CoA transferase